MILTNGQGIKETVERLRVPGDRRGRRRPTRAPAADLALYIGGMGSRGTNFYNDLARKCGYDKEARQIQDLDLAGRKRAAEAAVPSDFLYARSLIGSRSQVVERRVL
jgi:hypothetical protein